jgi:hypothetical protein
MGIFATPDFGTSASLYGILVIVWAFVLLCVFVSFVSGIRLLKSGSPRRKRYGVFFLLLSAIVPSCCCLGPSQVIRLTYGNYPLGTYPNNKIKEGMTAEEVVAILGTPHERYKLDERESWYYWIDSFGIQWFAVNFGPDERVIRTYGN